MGKTQPIISSDQAPTPPFHLAAIFVVSAILIALQIILVRILSIASWHHFTYLVVSTALLGFGISGTILIFLGNKLLDRFSGSMTALSFCFAVTIPTSLILANMLPLDIRYALIDIRQVGILVLYHLCLLIPFLFGALIIGLALIRYTNDVSRIYGANLIGSGFGALMIIFLFTGIPPYRLLLLCGGIIFLSSFAWMHPFNTTVTQPKRNLYRWVVPFSVLIIFVLIGLNQSEPSSDPYKQSSILERWSNQGDAQLIATNYSSRSRLDLFSSPRLHHTLFAGLTAEEAPSSQYALLEDGHHAGAVFRIRSPEEASIMDDTPQSLPYSLFPAPSVLLLGERGGTNVWLARRHNASKITVVQPDRAIIEIVNSLSDSDGGLVFKGDDLDLAIIDTRSFLEESDDHYDIIQICEMEGMASGASGLLSLHENRLLTIEGLRKCLERLNPGGVLCITRGLQMPPRDNPKILATLKAAIIERNSSNPGEQVVQVHNYLAGTNLAFSHPIDSVSGLKLIKLIAELKLKIDHYPNSLLHLMDEKKINSPDINDNQSPAYFATRLFQNGGDDIVEEWGYDIRPPSDDRPYFYNFFRWKALKSYFQTYGNNWFQRLELGYVVVVLVFLEVVFISVFLILLPVILLKRNGFSKPAWATILYFGAIGFGFMFFEMQMLQRFSLLFGNPVYSMAFTIGSILLLSGFGSLFGRKKRPEKKQGILYDGLIIAILIMLSTLALTILQPLLFSTALPFRIIISILLLAPPAIFMGRPFPSGLFRLHNNDPSQKPLAWGVNGFASVSAAPLAVIIAVSEGFLLVSMLGMVCYLVASIAWMGMPKD